MVLLAFSVPKAYEMRKDEVDDVLNSVQKQSSSIYKQYAEPYVQKIPRCASVGKGFRTALHSGLIMEIHKIG